MAIGIQQADFSIGEIDPRMRARVNLDQYYSSLDKGRNVLVSPLGGFSRRKGTEYEGTLVNQIARVTGQTITCPNGGTTANANDDDESTDVLTTAGVGTTNPYVVVHYDLGSAQAILFADVQGLYSDHSADLTGEMFIQYSTDDISWTSLGSAIDLNKDSSRKRNRRRTGPITAQYWRVARIGSTDLSTAVITLSEFTLWTDSGTLSGFRLARHRFNVAQKYVLVFTDRNIRIFQDGVYQADVRSPYDESDLSEINWVQRLDTAVMVHEDYQQQTLTRQGSSTDWQVAPLTISNIPKYPFDISISNPATTLTPSATSGVVTLTAGGATFTGTAADVGQYVDGNGGRARIIKHSSTTVATAVTVFPFYDNGAIASGDWQYETGYEDVWSSTRGYPTAVSINKGRLAFGGGSRPSTYWMSRALSEFDFNLGQNLDDDGIDVTISGDDDAPEIYHLVSSGGDLQIFTSSGEYVNSRNAAGVTTPDSAGADEQSAHGVRKSVRPVKVASGTLYIQREGKALREFTYDAIKERYQAQNISILASHLLVSPVSMAYRPATSNDESDLVFIVNNDGTCAVLTTLRDQDITAYSLLTTDGLYKDVVVDLTDIYFIVERTIDGNTVRYLEKYNENLRMDAGYYEAVSSAKDTISVPWLAGEEVEIRLDGLLQSNQTVPAGGSLTFSRNAEETIEVGLSYSWQGKLQPIATSLQDGTKVGDKKRIVKATLELFETEAVKVNGQELTFQKFGPAATEPLLDAASNSFTGRKEVDGMQGYSLEAQLDLTGDKALDATILGVEMKVAL